MQTGYDIDKRKLLSSLSHGSIFFSPLLLTIGIPLSVLFVSDDPVVKQNAREAINFHLNVWALGVVAGIIGFFWWTLILIPLIWVLGAILLIMTWIEPIFAILKSLNNPDQAFRYPFIFRIL